MISIPSRHAAIGSSPLAPLFIVFTLHGRWVERSLVTGRSKYGLHDAAISALLAQYYQTGFGYANYPGSSSYGVSVAAPEFVLSQLVRLPVLKLITYHERGWDNHQDVICLQKLTTGSLLDGTSPVRQPPS